MGSACSDARACDRLQEYAAVKGELPGYYNLAALGLNNEPRFNLDCSPGICEAVEGEAAPCPYGDIYLTALPILCAEQRLGTFVLTRCGGLFDHDDIILAEIGATLLGLILSGAAAERQQEKTRNKNLAAVAFESLSYSEVEAIEEIFRNLQGEEGIIVASKIADDLGITRSVIVNALRKFESAGIIESRSLGMKGTYIRAKNRQALDEIASRSVKFKKEQA